MNVLHTYFGSIPVDGFVSKADLPAWERCAIASAAEAWREGRGYEPLTVEQAKAMPEWQPRKVITSQGYIYER